MNNNSLFNAMATAGNRTVTTNGEVAHKTTNNSVLDLFSRGGAMRTASDSDLLLMFNKAMAEDSLLATKTMFYLRDVRGGQGERKVFRTMLKDIANSNPDIVRKNITNIVEFGRWDDVVELLDTPLVEDAVSLIREQLNLDISGVKDDTSISLAGKWLPSINASSKDTKRKAKKLAKMLGMRESEYRKTLSKLRKKIDIVETKMASKDWEGIEYGKVPSRASVIYRNAFRRNDENGYANYLSEVEKGNNKINSSVNVPSDIYKAYKKAHGSVDKTLELSWKSLPNYAEDAGNVMVVADVSGSMTGEPMANSVSLALYFAERNTGAFHNMFLTFDSNPSIQMVKDEWDLHTKLRHIERAPWGMSTDLKATYKLILDNAVNNNVPAEDMPSTLVIISDMQFNQGNRSGRTAKQEMDRQFEAHGYKTPTIVWWNVNDYSNTPVEADDQGNVLVSGSAPITFKQFMSFINNSDEVITPYTMMLDVLNNGRYDQVTV